MNFEEQVWYHIVVNNNNYISLIEDFHKTYPYRTHKVTSNHAKHQMGEFRVFIPILSNDVQGLLTQEELREYSRLQNVVLPILGYESSFQDSRNDRYIIGPDYFGLKFRNESKLEIKIRTNRPSLEQCCIESWSKQKVKKSIAKEEGIDEIMRLLTERGHENTFSQDREFLIQQKSIVVAKHRRNQYLDSVCVEICSLCDVTQTPSFDALRWYSLCIEGEVTDLLSVLSTGPSASALTATQLSFLVPLLPALEALIQMATILKHSIERSIPATSILSSVTSSVDNSELTMSCVEVDVAAQRLHHCVPVAGGYPSWIRVIGSGIMQDEALSRIHQFSEMISRIVVKITH